MDAAREHRVGPYLKSITHRLRLWQNRRLEQHGLTASQISLLMLLWNKNGQSQTEIRDQLDVAPSSVAGLLDLLEAKGLVRREQDGADARVKRIWLTPAGWDVWPISRQDLDELEEQMTAGFLQEEKALLLVWLQRLQANLCEEEPSSS